MKHRPLDSGLLGAAALSVAVALSLAPPALAASDTGRMGASATVVGRAHIIAVADIDVGEHGPTDPTPVDAVGSVTVRATRGATYRMFVGEALVSSSTSPMTTVVYGRVAPLQDVQDGSYVGAVVITVEW